MKHGAIALGGGVLLALWLTQTETGGNALEAAKALLPGAFQRSVESGRGSQYYATIEATAADYGLPENLLSRVAYQESRFNPSAKSGAGAMGMFQFMPITVQDMKQRFGYPFDPFNWQQSAVAAAKYLAYLYRQFSDWQLALAAYNWGEGNLRRKGLANAPAETQKYYAQILADVQGA